MKTEKEIREHLKDFDRMETDKTLYQGPRPLSEYAYWQDIGFKNALNWVLDSPNLEDKVSGKG